MIKLFSDCPTEVLRGMSTGFGPKESKLLTLTAFINLLSISQRYIFCYKICSLRYLPAQTAGYLPKHNTQLKIQLKYCTPRRYLPLFYTKHTDHRSIVKFKLQNPRSVRIGKSEPVMRGIWRSVSAHSSSLSRLHLLRASLQTFPPAPGHEGIISRNNMGFHSPSATSISHFPFPTSHFPKGHTGNRQGSQFMQSPPCPIPAISSAVISSPARMRGNSRSKIVMGL